MTWWDRLVDAAFNVAGGLFGFPSREEWREVGDLVSGKWKREVNEDTSSFITGTLIPRLEEYEAPGEIIQTLREAAALSFPMNVVMALMMYSVYATTELGSRMAMFMTPVQMGIARDILPARPDPVVGWEMVRKSILGEQELHGLLADQGWSESLIDYFGDITRPLMGLAEAMEVWRRGDLSDTEFYALLSRYGYSVFDQAQLGRLKDRMPGPGDLISMAVREAFHPELIAKYHYMDRFPPEFAHWMEKQGFSRDWAEKWWVAHWRLPAIRDAFEMLHRGEIAVTEVKDLLMTADIAPVWHDPLIAIAYHPYTRVDVRRMHKVGVLTDAQLLRAYQDAGYDLEKATKMAEFTIAYNMSGEVEATKGEILKGYRLGVLNYSEALSGLLAIDISEALARYFLSMEDYKHEQDLADEQIKTTGELYVAGQISKSEAYGRLNALGLSAERVERLFVTWDIRIERKITIPSKGELETFFKEDIIDGGTYTNQLERRGYSSTYVGWYYANLLIEIEEEAREAEEKAAKEAERIREATEKTAYQLAKAEVNYQIAQLRAHYTEIRVAIERQIAAPERRQMMGVIEDSTLEIARITSEIADKGANLARAKETLVVYALRPEVIASYDLIDNADMEMANLRATIADLQVIKREAQAAIRVVAIGTEVAAQREIIEGIKVDIADEKADIARLKLIIAEAKAGLIEAWTAEDIARLEDEMRTIELRIRELESERARLRLAI